MATRRRFPWAAPASATAINRATARAAVSPITAGLHSNPSSLLVADAAGTTDTSRGRISTRVLAPGKGDGPGDPLYLTRHRIRSGSQTIKITVPREPSRAGIDPYRKLIDREREDNVVAVKAAGAR